MRSFGSLRIASIIAIVFLSLAQCMPNKNANEDDYPGDGEYDEDATIGNDDDDPTQPADAGPAGPIHVRSRNSTLKVWPGDTVEFPCAVDNAEDTVISWSRDSELLFVGENPVSDDKRFSRAPNSSLILRNVDEEDAKYEYRCQILVKPPIVISHKLQIVDEPREPSNVVHVTPSKRVEVVEGMSTSFGCDTSIEPKPHIIWSHKGERLHNGEEIEAGGNFIKIKKATRHHAGLYQCLIDNGSEKLPHAAIEVIVKHKPVIETEHETVHTGTGLKSTLTCIVHSQPRAKVTWHKNQKMINEKNGRRSLIDDKTRHSLVIEHTSQHDFGQYHCVAKNQYGEASRMIELTGTPSRPRFHDGEYDEEQWIFLSKWHVESYAPITEYKLEYRSEGESTWKSASPRVYNGRGNQFTAEHALRDLQPGSYEVKLMAKNEYGWSQFSGVHTFRIEYAMENKPAGTTGGSGTTQPIFALTGFLVFLLSSYQSNYL